MKNILISCLALPAVRNTHIHATARLNLSATTDFIPSSVSNLNVPQRTCSSDCLHAFGRFDTLRTLRLAAYGGAVAGPLGHYWFGFLDARIFPQAPKR